MPSRIRNVRASVRQLVETVDPVHRTPGRSYTHLRWQRIKIWPLMMSEVFSESRRGHNAQWRAITRKAPAIQDGWRVVTYLGGEYEMTLEVVKVSRSGKQQILLLNELGPAQS